MRFLTVIIIAIFALAPISASAGDVIRILAIGNSFSEDAVEQNLHELCASQGKTVIIGNLFIPACTVDIHYKNIVNSLPAYSFRLIDEQGRKHVRDNVTLQEAIESEQWDYISFQQGSQYSGIYSSLGNLGDLMRRVRQYAGRYATFAWHSTWAYAPSSTHAGFEAYGRKELQMYHAIVETAEKVMRRYPQIKILIPSGTAIQNARTAIVAGRDLTRDGYHLELTVGRYTAACTWYVAIFHEVFNENVYIPDNISPRSAQIAREAAIDAVTHPYSITPLTRFIEVSVPKH